MSFEITFLSKFFTTQTTPEFFTNAAFVFQMKRQMLFMFVFSSTIMTRVSNKARLFIADDSNWNRTTVTIYKTYKLEKALDLN